MRYSASVALVLSMVAATALNAERRPIDTERSTLTVFAYKSGLFSAFADDHVVRSRTFRFVDH